MSERRAKQLRKVERRLDTQESILTAYAGGLDDLAVRMTACEAGLNSFLRCELETQTEALEVTRQDLRRSRKRARSLEESLWTWKAVAAAALVSTVLTIILTIIM